MVHHDLWPTHPDSPHETGHRQQDHQLQVSLSFPFEILRWPSRSTHRIGPTLFLLLFDAVKVALTAQEELPADDRRGSAEAVVQLVHRQRLRRVVAMAQDLRDAV
jgi:hypothetical protein